MDPTRRSKNKVLSKKMWSILKKSNHLATKAINGLFLHHNSLTCLPDHPSNQFFSPSKLDYQFSCNNSPAIGPYLAHMAHHHKPKPKSKSKSRPRPDYHLEMFNTTPERPTILGSPLGMGLGTGIGTEYFLPGFGNGKSPLARQLRVTDSPFSLKDGKWNEEELEEDLKLNKAADEFIKKFYEKLRIQKSLESPYHMWAR